jgi:hypothetical protein
MVDMAHLRPVRDLLRQASGPVAAADIASRTGIAIESVYEVLVRLYDEHVVRIVTTSGRTRPDDKCRVNYWESLA